MAIVITLAEGYPWLSVQEGALLDPTNPYSEMFNITNGGYIPVTNLDATCIMNFTSPYGGFKDSGARYQNFANYLSHGGSATIPCFTMLDAGARQVPNGAKYDVTIVYSYYGLNYSSLRRHQSFHFQSTVGRDGLAHWIFLAP